MNITVPNVSGYYSYHITPGSIVDGVKIPGAYSIKAYFCGYVIMDHSGTAYDAFGDGYALCDDPSLNFFRDFDFTGPNGVFVYTDHNRCEGGSLWSGGYIGESIASSNAEYVNDETLQPVGNGISYEYNGDYRYTIISKLPFDAQPEQTTISSTVMGVTKSLSYELIPQSRFSIQGETLTYQDFLSFTLEPQVSFMSVIKANLRIVSGGGFASLLDTETWEIAGDNVDVYSDNLGEYLLVMDNNPDDSISVVVEYETTGNIQRDTIKIMPFLNVSVEPPIIATGDTADVKIKIWDTYENNYVKIPGWYQCEIGITENCGNGMLLLPDGTSGEFFTEVSGTNIKFVAADSTGTDSISIEIKAGVLDGGGGATKSLISQESKALKKGSTLLENNKISKDSLFACLDKSIKENFRKKPASVTSCTPAEFNSVIMATSEVAVANIFKPWEAKVDIFRYDGYSGNVYVGNELRYVNNEWQFVPKYEDFAEYLNSKCNAIILVGGASFDRLGFFAPYWDVPFKDFELFECKKSIDGYHFKVKNETFLFKVFKDICTNNIDQDTKLENISDIDLIPEDKLVEAYKEIKKQFIYGGGDKYIIVKALRLHEDQHDIDFYYTVQNSLNITIDEKIKYMFASSGLKYKDAFSSYYLATDNYEKAKEDFWIILYYLKSCIKEGYSEIITSDYEQATQDSPMVQDELKEYLKRVEERLNSK